MSNGPADTVWPLVGGEPSAPTDSGDRDQASPAGQVDGRTRSRRPIARAWAALAPHQRVGLAVFVGLLAVLAVRNRFVFTAALYDDGDAAANSILIDRARHFRLLIGNYSRVGFFHPGPALLYVQAWGEQLFHDAIPLTRTAFDAHVFAILVLNAALVATSAGIVARRTASHLAAVGLVLAVLGVATLEPGLLSTTWMPNVYVWPFLLLLVAATSVGTGQPAHLPLLALAFGLLVHGHVSFVVIAGAIVALAVIGLALSHRLAGTPGPDRRTLVVTGVVLALFALPIVVNLVLHWPGQLRLYWRYSRATQGHGYADALRFVRDYWPHGWPGLVVPLALASATVLLALRSADRGARRFLVGAVAVAVAASAVSVYYAARGVDDLRFRYVAYYYRATQVVLVAACLAAAVRLVRSAAVQRIVAVALVAGCVLAATDSGLTPPQGVAWPPAAYAAVPDGDGPLAFHVGPDAWPQAGGLMEYSRRQGREVCFDDPALAVVFTEDLLCSVAQRRAAEGIVVVQNPGAKPAGRLLFANDRVVVSLAGGFRVGLSDRAGTGG